MPQRRSFKSIFVEIVSFLTLFALIGTMTSNFWERYLIQSELSNIKSSLHILKETVYKIGTAYDNLHHELNGLVEINDMKSKDSTHYKHRNNIGLKTITNLMLQELRNMKDNNLGKIASTREDSETCSPPKEKLKCNQKNVTTTTKNLKSTGVNVGNKQSRQHEYTFRTKNIHKCCFDDDCYDNENNYRKF